MTPSESPEPGDSAAARHAVEAVWRIESSHVVASLTRLTRDFALAEDAAQEALAQALEAWPRTGVPDNPAAWLVTTGRRRAADALRRRDTLREKYEVIAAGDDGDLTDEEWDPERVPDDVLALMLISCHPVLSSPAQVALTLRVVGGLRSDEIARAFLVPVATVQARITRAKKTLAAARVPFEVPPPEERPARIGAVMSVLYLLFTEGSTASSGDDWLRPDLAAEAVRLARVVTHLAPREPEAYGLLALMELTAARFPARVGADGSAILLEDQDRRRWDRSAIRRGLAALGTASQVGRGLGAYGVQAAISACHARAGSVAETDWEEIVILYEALGRLAPSSVVELNRAVAVSMAHGPEAALGITDRLVAEGRLALSHLLPAVRGELLSRLGRPGEAAQEWAKAIRLCDNEREQDVLRTKIAALG